MLAVPRNKCDYIKSSVGVCGYHVQDLIRRKINNFRYVFVLHVANDVCRTVNINICGNNASERISFVNETVLHHRMSTLIAEKAVRTDFNQFSARSASFRKEQIADK